MSGHNWKYSPRGFWYCTKCESVSNSHRPARNVKIPDHRNVSAAFHREWTCDEMVVRKIMES